MVNKITTSEFKKLIYNIDDGGDMEFKGDNPVLVDFYTEWCGPCKMLDPILTSVSEKYNGKVDFYKVNIEEEMEIAMAFGARSIPTLLYIPLEGDPTVVPGAPSESGLVDMVEGKLLNNKGIISDNSSAVLIKEVMINIDTLWDFKIAQYLNNNVVNYLV